MGGSVTEIDGVRHEPIAIVGMAGRFPGARNVGEFWHNLLDGMESISFFDDEELRAAGVPEKELRDPNYVRAAPVIDQAEWLDAALFGISNREAEVLDPQHRVLLETSYTALQHAGCDPASFEGRIGIFAGGKDNAYLDKNIYENDDLVRAVGGFVSIISNHTDYLSTGVAYRLNLRGPAVNVVTACSTSLVAIHLAARALRGRECEMAVAGGVEIAIPLIDGYLYNEGGIFSPDGHVRPFDARAHGTVFGSGCGAVALKRLSDALADRDPIHAVIRGSAINNDGSSKTAFSTPSMDGQVAVVGAALRDAGVDPASIGYIEAHGTGTLVGDPIEVGALTEAYRRYTDRTGYCAISSVKANVGHLGAAAGVCGLIKAVNCVSTGLLPPSVNFDEPNPRIDFAGSPFYVNTTPVGWRAEAKEGLRRAGVSSFGIGGTNAHLVIEQSPEPAPVAPSRRPYQLFTLSARTPTALDAATAELGEHLQGEEAAEPADVAYTLNVGRPDHVVRRVLVASCREEAVARLRGERNALPTMTLPTGTQRSAVFLFPGQGAQYVQMARSVYAAEPTFAACVDHCAQVLAESHGLDLRRLLFPEQADERAAERLNQTAVTQPALFAIEYGLAQLLREWGVEPVAMAGHSIGEYVAACLAGVIRLDDAIRLVADRGALMQALPAGSMLAVTLPEEFLVPMLPAEVDLAAVNAPGVCVVSGPADEIRRLQETLALQGVGCRPLHTSHAFHSRMMDPILEAFRERVAAVPLAPPAVPYVSNLTGSWITADQATDPDYWVRHLRGCVRFSDTLKLLTAGGEHVLAEVGPGRTLTGLVAAHDEAGQPPAVVVPTMRHPRQDRDDVETLLESVGRIWSAGATVDWQRFWAGEHRRRVPLPAYPYERQRYWVDPDNEDPTGRSIATGETGAFFVSAWRETAPPASGNTPLAGDTLWVVFANDGDEIVGGLAERLRRAGGAVVVVQPGDQYAAHTNGGYTVRPGASADYRRLLSDVAARGAGRIRLLHGWTVGQRPADHEEREYVQHWLDRGFFSVLTVLQEAARQLVGTPINLCVLTSDMQDVTGDGRVEPAKAAVLGLVKVAPKEFDGLGCRAIDISLTASAAAESIARQMFDEVVSDAHEEQVAYRGRKRWIWSYVSVQPDGPDGAPARLKERGVYVVTGGLGGLGLVLAPQLARLVRARLVLVGRSGLPDRATWPALLADKPSTDRVVQRIRAVQAVEAAGGEVLVCTGDVTDEARMREIRTEAERVFDPIDGVFHLAGVAGGGMLETRSREAAEGVIGPKVTGAYVLDSVFGDVDLLVLYSSIVVVSGDFGLGDYVGANAVIDAFAQARWAEGRQVVVIDWPPWAEAGMAYDVDAPAIIGSLRRGRPVAEVRHKLLRRRIDEPDGGTTFDVDVSPAKWVFADHQLDGTPTMPGTGVVELIRGLHEEITGDPLAEIRDLVFMRPLKVEPGAEVRAALRPAADSSFDVTISGYLPGGTRLEYARGNVRAAEGGAAPVHDLAILRKECPDDTTPPFAGNIGVLRFGPRWDILRSRLAGPGMELVRVELPEEFAGDVDDYVLHPAVLDNCVAVGQDVTGEGTYLPFSYDRIVVRAPLPPRVYGIIRHRDDTRGDITVADVTVVDDDGVELVAVEGFTLLGVDGGSGTATAVAAAASGATGPVAGSNGSGPAPDGIMGLAGLIDASDAELGVSSADGEEVLRLVLASGIGPQVTWCPEGITERLRRTSRVTRAALSEQLTAMASAATSGTRDLATPYVEPTTDTERALAQLWGDTLGLDRVGVDDDFFELGGNSLIAVQLVARVAQRFSSDVSVAALFDSRTVRNLAAVIEEALMAKIASLTEEEALAALAALEASE
jgi:acyl transferase domain-containing protein